jgi:uncharacterized protein (DUF983 family)
VAESHRSPRTLSLVCTAIVRGWAKRCPHCGEGPLYAGWIRALDRCPHCGLVYERNQGDTWMFITAGDRLFIAAFIVLIYFGVHRTFPNFAIALFGLVVALFVWTTPNRWGVGTALHYLSRAFSEDVDDPIPPLFP